jgi:hypothetical protein
MIPGMVGGSTKPLLEYDAKARAFKIDDKVLSTITMIVDVERAQAGWIKFTDASPPAFELVSVEDLTNGAAYPPMPKDVDSSGRPLWPRGFKCTVKVSDQLAGEGPTVREWASCALATTRGFDSLHDLWVAGRQTGRVPVVCCDQFEEEPGQVGSNYRPVFKIVKWIARPKDMLEEPKEAKPAVVDPGKPEDFADELNDDIPW